ncbi:hypothetical protein WH96_07525 [Kiloniella spongiae]|uniref:Uncharacterized protein n=1 Tax=Kiloniella spongiae TaxID=1489064 RepID=A0A0H2MXQ6_9PROT|nr:hypothetical protein [Kiloniella spongiae]KLN61460.1 hypothetical protein WH96_07525 [Kiloniella spongiae]
MTKQNNNTEWGWLDVTSPFTQNEGFFVDQNNEIHYWPTKSGPGYKISEETAFKVMDQGFQNAHWQVVIITITIFGIMLTFRSLAALLYPFVTEYFSPIFFSMTVLMIFVVGIMAPASHYIVLAHRKLRILPEILKLLTNHEEINHSRPKVQYLKTLGWSGSRFKYYCTLFSIIIGFGGTSGVLFFASFEGIFTEKILLGEKITLLAGSIVCFWIVFLIIKRCIYGAWPDEVRLYQFSEHPDEFVESVSRPQSRWKSFLEKLDWMTSGWRLLVFGTPVLIIGIILLVEIIAEPITVENLTVQYDKAIFKPISELEDLSVPEKVVIKWPSPLIVYMSSPDSNDPNSILILEEIKRVLPKYAETAGLELYITNEQSNGVDLTIQMSPDFMFDPNGDHHPYDYDGQYQNGLFLSMTVKISPKSFHQILGGNYFGDGKAIREAHRQMVSDILLATLGVPRYTGTVTDWYEDKSGERLYMPYALLALHYDHRVNPGKNQAETLPVIRKIAKELEDAESFEIWFRRKNQHTQ